MGIALLPPANSPAAVRPIPGLSRRERDALDGLLSGLPHKQIAERLGLSPHTVHTYVKNVYKRYQVSSQAELMALFIPQNRSWRIIRPWKRGAGPGRQPRDPAGRWEADHG